MVSLVELLTRSKFMGGSIRNEGDTRDFECSNGVEKSWVHLLSTPVLTGCERVSNIRRRVLSWHVRIQVRVLSCEGGVWEAVGSLHTDV